MNTKQKTVDVLAVMAGAAAVLDTPTPCETANLLRQARAAVAELIAADNRFDAAFYAWMCDRKNQGVVDELCLAIDIRAAALSSVGGAK